MKLRSCMKDQIRIKVVSADIWGSLRLLNGKEIEIFQVEREDDLTYSFVLGRRNYAAACTLLERRGDSVSIQGLSRLYFLQKSVLERPVLYIGLCLLVLLSFLLPTRILGIQVEGNHTIPTRRILEAAEGSGIRLFAPCAEVRSERMKNALLSAIPELQWAGINTFGCRAVISVRERASQDAAAQTDNSVSSIVAARDGIVESVTALQGTALCQPGQAVKKGQTLISGYTDCGISIRAGRAEGEIYAQTLRTVRAMTPANQALRAEKQSTRHGLALVIGKKRINLWKGSGISDITCGRISTEYQLVLPGGFPMPVLLICETITQGDAAESSVEADDTQRGLERFAQEYLLNQMIAGRVLYSDEVMETLPGAYLLTGQYLCTEMIGRERLEIGDLNEHSGGTDR